MKLYLREKDRFEKVREELRYDFYNHIIQDDGRDRKARAINVAIEWECFELLKEFFEDPTIGDLDKIFSRMMSNALMVTDLEIIQFLLNDDRTEIPVMSFLMFIYMQLQNNAISYTDPNTITNSKIEVKRIDSEDLYTRIIDMINLAVERDWSLTENGQKIFDLLIQDDRLLKQLTTSENELLEYFK